MKNGDYRSQLIQFLWGNTFMQKNVMMFSMMSLLLSNISYASQCQIALSLSGPIENYEREIVSILSDKNYTVKILRSWEDGRNVKHTSWIGMESAGDMQFKKCQRIQLITTDGQEIADESIQIGLLSNKERAVLKFLENDVTSCD
jgi:hypothetical protein